MPPNAGDAALAHQVAGSHNGAASVHRRGDLAADIRDHHPARRRNQRIAGAAGLGVGQVRLPCALRVEEQYEGSVQGRFIRHIPATENVKADSSPTACLSAFGRHNHEIPSQ